MNSVTSTQRVLWFLWRFYNCWDLVPRSRDSFVGFSAFRVNRFSNMQQLLQSLEDGIEYTVFDARALFRKDWIHCATWAPQLPGGNGSTVAETPMNRIRQTNVPCDAKMVLFILAKTGAYHLLGLEYYLHKVRMPWDWLKLYIVHIRRI